jgi:hypothetical protein
MASLNVSGFVGTKSVSADNASRNATSQYHILCYMDRTSVAYLWLDTPVSRPLVRFASFPHKYCRSLTCCSRIVPILSLIPFGFGMVSIFLTCQTYIVDAFPMYAASAVAATTCLRSIVGAFLVSAQCYLRRRHRSYQTAIRRTSTI